ncbi:hypothetical protein F2Q69_00024025 [Brassica cretica]|uniref:Uncharacterized protein n=1 Tax=Brassica cretica TaxID=69181 RepID=A0A8S9Q1K6_BRACR|nr:hypothetical protein F2Q69_00024025 [Brassica cretica]
MGIDLGEIGYSKITVRAAAVRLEPSRRGLGCPNQVKLNVLPRGEIGYPKITVRAAAVRLEPSQRGLGCPNQVKLNVLPRGGHFTRTRTEITKYPNGY